MEVIGRAVLSGSESDRQITAALMTLSQEWRRVVCVQRAHRRLTLRRSFTSC